MSSSKSGIQPDFLEEIFSCRKCSFRDDAYPPLPPVSAPVPVKLLLIGENPSWAEEQQTPFDPRTISGQALDRNYLEPLGLERVEVWITDLFKCRYPKEIYLKKGKYARKIQAVADTCARQWLIKELCYATPKVVATLSDREVYQRLQRIFNPRTPSRFQEAVGQPWSVKLGEVATLLFPMIHPDISRPPGEGDNRKITARQKWAPRHHEEHIPALRRLVESPGGIT
ncbi:MAG TPA: hypothetical protein DCP08_08565 [Chloroflexi bacterium]|nr:hypothetical protein [Chloroflexota bacterium]